MEKKFLETEVTSKGQRRIIGVASTFGPPHDLDGDIIAHGAFDESIKALQAGKKLKLLDGHMPSAKNTIGLVEKLWVEGDKLMFEASISKSASGEDIYIKLQEGVLDQVSIGFSLLDYDYQDDGLRVIKKGELFEISVVPIPANPRATLTEVKHKESQDNSDQDAKEFAEQAANINKQTQLHNENKKLQLREDLRALRNRGKKNG